jgi:hypothetical protein
MLKGIMIKNDAECLGSKFVYITHEKYLSAKFGALSFF